MSEAIVKLTADHIKIKGGEYVRDYPHGRWTKTNKDMGEAYPMGVYTCSACGDYAYAPYKFCPNCGADMREREGE